MHNHPAKPITVTVANAIALSGIQRTKLYELINQGKIKTITIGRRRLVIYSSLEELADTHKA
jgi:excisionase family DNA binding protein